MLRLKKVAVTGSLASGKSTVCRLFEKKGAKVVSADAIVHQLLSPQTSVGKRVIELFGQDVVSEGVIDRKKVAERVFNEREALDKLEQILHPAVLAEMEKEYEKAVKQKAPLFVAEVPLLFESGQETNFDDVIVVISHFAKERYKGSFFEERRRRLLSDEEKIKKANYVIDNDGDENHLEEQINKLLPLLTKDTL